MMVRLEQLYRVTTCSSNESTRSTARPDRRVDNCGQLYKFDLTVKFSPARPRHEAPRGSDRCRRPSEVDRDASFRSRSQARPRGHPGRGPRGLLVPAARAQARGLRGRGPKALEAGRSGSTQPRQAGSAAPSAKANFRDRLHRRSSASARPSRPTSTCRACWCSSTRAAAGTGIRFTQIATGERTAGRPRPRAGAGPRAGRLGHKPPGPGRRPDRPERARAERPRPRTTRSSRQPGRERGSAVRRRRDRHPDLARRPGGLPIGGGEPTTTARRAAVAAPAARDRPARAGVRRRLLQPRGLLPRRQALRARREQQRGRERPPDHDRGRPLRQRPGALPADQGRDHGDRLPVAEGAGRDRRRHPAGPAPRRRPTPATTPDQRHATPRPDRNRDP